MSSIDTLNCVVKTRTKVKQCKVHCQQVRLGFVQEYRDDSITDDVTKLRRAFFRAEKSIITGNCMSAQTVSILHKINRDFHQYIVMNVLKIIVCFLMIGQWQIFVNQLFNRK